VSNGDRGGGIGWKGSVQMPGHALEDLEEALVVQKRR
jgi:hypothetical protein